MMKSIFSSLIFIAIATNLWGQVAQPGTTSPTIKPPTATTSSTGVNASSGEAPQKAPSVKSDSEDNSHKVKNEVLFSVGGNLNFTEKVRITGLYYDVNVFCDPLFNSKSGKASRWGVDARLSQGKFVFQPDTSELRERYYSTEDQTLDSITVLTQKFSYIRNETPTYLAVSLTPTFRLSSQLDFPLYIAGHFEYVQRKNRLDLENIVSSESEGKFSTKSLPGQIVPVKVTPGKNTVVSRSDNFNYAIGLKFFKEFEDAVVNIKPLIGYGSNGESNGLFYFTHFEVIERKMGFKIGGELRGIFTFKTISPSRKQDFEPYIALYFAKTFRFSKIKEVLNL